MSINEVIKFIYLNTTDDYIIVDCQILEELVENLKNNTKPIYPLDEIKGIIADIKASLPINKEMKNTLKEFVAEIDSKFFNGDKIEEKKSAKIPNIGYKKMGDIVANMNWDKLDSVDFKNMHYRLDDFYVDERFAINQKDYMKAFNKCEDNPKMLGKTVEIKATRLEDNQPLIIICELDERADVENLYMYDFNIVEVMLDTF